MTPIRYPSFTLSALATGALVAATAQAQEAQTVRIAHAGPTSGGIAHIGKDNENGVRMAIDDPLLQGRLFSYLDTQLSRLGGSNFAQIPINAPKCARW